MSMDNPRPHVPLDVASTLALWAKRSNIAADQLPARSQFRQRLRQAGGSVEKLAQAARAGEVVLAKPEITYAKVTFLLLIAERTRGLGGEAGQIRAWLASCR